MKKRVQILAAIFLMIFVSTSCLFMGSSIEGDGNVTTDVREVDSFDKIVVSRGVNVYLSQGETEKVVVKADKNLIDAIKTDVVENTLKITSNARVKHATSFKVFVTATDFSKIKTSSGSNVFSETDIKSENLELSSSSGSNMKIETETNNLTVSVSSGANIKLRGKVKKFRGSASSGANLMAEKLTADSCIAEASSGSNLWITVTTNFEGHASSGANVFYLGEPKSSDINASSGGNVIKR